LISLDAPLILNSYKKLAVIENDDIRTECLVDAYPKADITWISPSGQILSSFIEERSLNNTVRSSILHCKFILYSLLFN
jgi:hypothetical protein